MGHKPVRCAFRLNLFRCFAEGQRFGLRKHVCQKDVMVATERIECLVERYEVARNESRSLVDQLIKGMLAVGPRLTPVNGAGVTRHLRTIECNMFAVALHCQLLEISRESLQVLLIWQNRY